MFGVASLQNGSIIFVKKYPQQFPLQNDGG